ncbi:protein translocase subunit SecF [Marinobacteraceae bacterium S3BR75-40.1]
MTDNAPYKFDFMGKRRVWGAISIILILVSVASLAWRGVPLGLDFTGGTLIELEYQDAPSLPDVRSTLQSVGYPDVVVQNFGSKSEVLVRLPAQFNQKVVEHIVGMLKEQAGEEVTLKRAEYVGAQVGKELREKGGMGMLLALGVVLIYVAMRFQFKFGVASVLPLGHDVIITLGMFSIFQWDFDLTVLAALLAVVGYSINDTIIVADRIRENFRRIRKDDPVEVINISLNQTLSRTLMTSGTTLLVLISLFIFGGEMIRNFSIALIIGIVVGTYSSIYVAANLLLTMGVSREDLLLPVKEGAKNEEEETPPDWLNRM